MSKTTQEVYRCDRCGETLTLPGGEPPHQRWRQVKLGRQLDGPGAAEVDYSMELCADCVTALETVITMPFGEDTKTLDRIIQAGARAIGVKEGMSAWESLYRWVPTELRPSAQGRAARGPRGG